ncbi:ESPR-type extended signal peptide-containing protein [Megasphaera sp.]|uniref:ESPR-type extended signal peptide-containing protein n=1 Tax=Megasphaera sp. TaxID=2023260 RepID=UPI00258E9FC4|nr:ESPR-type extended signal peptide-containing protein [Megasphaera sp.]
MNRIYKVIWSKVKNCYIVVSEIAKSHSKPVSTKLNAGKTVAAVLAVAALCAGMTTSAMAADKYYSVDDYEGRLASMGNADNSGAQGFASLAAGIGSKVEEKAGFQGATATVVGALNTVAAGTQMFDGVANSIVGVANATQNANATLIFGAGNAVTNSYADVNLDPTSIDPTDPVGTARKLGAAVGESGGQVLVIGGANSVDYARFSAVTGVSNTLNGKAGDTSDYNFITGAKNTLTNTDSTYVIGSSNTVSDGTSNVVIGDKRKLTGATNDVVIGAADNEMETKVSDATILGHNANSTVANGVALGSNSVASVDKGVAGYNPSTKALTGDAWTSTVGSVSVGDAANGITRQITSVAAGKEDTDAVNVAQLKANKVTLKQGDNVTITSTVADDGATTYTIKSTDTNTTLASGTVTYVGADGTLKLKDSDNNEVTVTGLKNTYLTGATLENNTLTLTQNEGSPITVTGIATTAELAANKVKYFSVNSTVAANQNNDGAKGLNSIAIGPNAKAEHENGIALGTNVLSGGKGSIVIGSDARVAQNIALDGSIVIGKNAEAFTGGGKQEALLGMDPTNWPNRGAGGYDKPTDTSRVATSIVIGTNASGRTGSIDIGDRVYKGTMGGREITDKNSSFHVNQTTLGTNTYNKGLFSTMVGSYSIATGGFDGGGGRNTLAYGAQNFGATVMGSLNSIRSNGSASFLSPSYQGIANTIVGLANITDNSNGSLVFGAGNKITNSITSISMPTSGADSVDAMVDKLQSTIKRSNSGGATLAIGGGNTADYTRASSIIGVNNTLTGTSSNISQYNALTGYNNTATNVDNVTVTGSNNKVTDTTTAVVIGDNRTLTGVNNNVVIGSADSALETTVSDAVAIGRNANVTIEGGAALGTNSVARTDKGVVGYDPSGRITDADSILGSNTQYQSLQTEVADAQTTIATLNSEAAELQGYMDQIKKIDPNGYEQQEAYQAFSAQYAAKQSEIATAQADLDSKQSALAEAGKALYTWQSTAGSVSVGDVSKGITRQITDVAAGTADTDAVNVAQLKANKVTVAAGNDNVTVTSTSADDGGTTYTVASKDTYTTKGTYDADSKKITFTQNDTEKNYEVDLSGLTDNIDKGLSFAGDSGDAINKQLGETMNIVGGATDVTTGSNIGVVSEDGKLNVRLAKDLTGLNSVKVGDAVTLGTTGLTITNGPSVTTTGINAGNQKITNVVAGVADTDAVNVSQLNANKIHYFHVNAPEVGTNYNNNGASGTDAIAIGKSTTAANNSVAIGNATILDSNGGNGSGDIAIGNNAKINNYADQGSGIALGANTFVENMAGKQEAIFALGQTTFSGNFLSTARIPADPSKVAAGIAIGENSYARSGSLMVGTHNYRGAIGDVTVDTSNIKATGVNVNATTLGTNSFNNGAFSTIAGAYSIASGSYAGGRNSGDAGKNFGATIVGSLNSIESATASNSNSGIANSIVGFANKTANANGALIFGAGNEITNSVTSITIPGTSILDGDSAADSAKELQNLMKESIADSNSGGSTLAIGGSNKADYTRASAIIGVKNTLTGTSSDISQYNYITGYNNTGTNVDNVTIIGTNRTVSDASNSVVIGSADSVMTSSASDAVTIGRNANTTVDGGVALGSGSIASVDKEVAGYDVTTGKASTQTSAAWKSTTAAVSVGDVANNVTRQITGVAAGMQDTDAVNVAQLKQVAEAATEAGKTTLKFTGDDTTAEISRGNGDTLNIIGGVKATDADGNSLLTDNNIGVVKDGDNALKVQLAKNLTGLNSVAVGDAVTLGTTGLTITNGPSVTTKGIDAGSKTITNVANGVNPTDAVNVSQLTANKVTVAEGTNVTVTPTTANDGSTTYTVAAKDTYTTAGTYDKAGKKITFTQNDTDKNYEVDVSGLVDGISEDIDKGLNFAGDSGDAINKKLDQTLDIVGGAKGDLTTGNIGVISEDGKLNVRLAKDVQDLNSVRIGGTTANGEGIYIANQSINNTKGTAEEGNYITGLENTKWDPTNKGYVSGRAATEDQLNSVYETINKNIESSKAVSGKNITVGEDNKVNLNNNITLGSDTDKAKQVNINGDAATVTAGDGVNKVVVDGTNGQVTIGDAANGGIVMGNQTVTPKVVGADGTETDGTAKSGQYITGLENTTWDPTGEGYVADRAATEGQLKNVADNISKQISDIDTAVKSTSRVFESDSGADAQVTRKSTDPMMLKGGATGELSDGNIGVVNNSDKTGFDIKLSKDIKGLNSIEVNNKITIGTGDNQTIIEGDTINTGSVTTGNTTINNEGLTIVNEDSSKNITINNNNVNMGGNVIKNIGEGSEPTDAINKTQFDRAINNLGTGMNQINNRVNKLDNRVNRVGAGAAALAALHPLEFSPDAKWEVTAGVGNYRGANAIALGAFYRPNFDTMFSIGTSYGGGENMINAGVTWRIGEGETKAYPSKTVMAQEIDDLKNVVSEQQDQIEELKKLVNSLINK